MLIRTNAHMLTVLDVLLRGFVVTMLAPVLFDLTSVDKSGVALEMFYLSIHAVEYLFLALQMCGILELDVVLHIMHMRIYHCSAQFQIAMPGCCRADCHDNVRLERLMCFFRRSSEATSWKNISKCCLWTHMLLQYHRCWRPCALPIGEHRFILEASSMFAWLSHTVSSASCCA